MTDEAHKLASESEPIAARPTLPTDIPNTAGEKADPHEAKTIGQSTDIQKQHIGIPGYEIQSELGRGGMGVVYQARQESLNRTVALKMILAGPHAGEQELLRFRKEAEAVARLHHPNIVQIHEVGEHQGHHFFSLEFIGGGTLADKIDGKPLPARQAARMVQLLAEAMQEAHELGIVHRDLKPANVLLTAEGQPKITDFGLAKRLDVDTAQTQSGAIMGTPGYMAPEQASGQTRAIGAAVDIFALGAILYELLTGRPPFVAATPLDTILQVMEAEPAPPRLLNPNLPRDLETICLKCLEKKPARRYRSAQDLAEDLARFLRGDSISIRSINVLDRLARTLERSQLDTEFYAWGTMLLAWAAIVLATHVLICFALDAYKEKIYNSAAYIAQFVLMGLAFWICRPRGKRRLASAMEKRLWIYCGAYALACFLLLPISAGLPFAADDRLFYSSYPYCCLLTGFFFIVLGSNFWGRFYAIGLLFFLLPIPMLWKLNLASLYFGVAWTGALFAIGVHLRRQGVAASNDDAT